jgi:hypothetical protein
MALVLAQHMALVVLAAAVTAGMELLLGKETVYQRRLLIVALAAAVAHGHLLNQQWVAQVAQVLLFCAIPVHKKVLVVL